MLTASDQKKSVKMVMKVILPPSRRLNVYNEQYHLFDDFCISMPNFVKFDLKPLLDFV